MARKPSSKSASSSKPPRTPRTSPSAPGAEEAPGHNSAKRNPAEMQEAFVDHRKHWNNWKAKRAVVDEIEREIKAQLKSDGFTVKQMQIADALSGTAKQDAKVQAEVRERLLVAMWMGHPMGAQLDMFDQPDRTPLADRAYDAGKLTSMENKAARPPYAPDTEAYRAFMAGFHDHQRELGGGIKAPRSYAESKLAHAEPAGQG